MKYSFYISIFILLLSFNFLIAQERIANGDFDKKTSSWMLEVHSPATGTFNIDTNNVLNGKNSGHVTITNTDGTNWHLQFQQIFGKLTAGTRLYIRFQACAIEDVSIPICIQQYHDSYSYFYQRNINLTVDKQSFMDSVDISVDDSNVKLAFIIGGLNIDDEVWFDSVSIMQTTITSVETNQTSNHPNNFDLMQNYPNPFNPSTNISFSIPSKTFVSLAIFDQLGRKVADLLSQELPAGTYTRQWNAEGLGSGIYYYRLSTEKYVATRKLLLLK